MMTISCRVAGLALAASLLLSGSAFAQTTAPATGTSTAPAADSGKKAQKPHTAASIECSKEADAKGLHGKERKKFRSDCKKQAKDAAAPAAK
jgi:psiF repeat